MSEAFVQIELQQRSST